MIGKMAEIKPCPLCGGRVAITEFIAKGGEPAEYSAKIQCRCGLTFEREWMPTEGYVELLGNDDIITAWNKRFYDCPESCATSARLDGNMLWVSPGVYERIKNNPNEIIVESQCQAPLYLKVVGVGK